MARTTEMRLIELMALSQDVDNVVEYLGKSGNFQFQSKRSAPADRKNDGMENTDAAIFDSLQKVRVFLGVDDCADEPLSVQRAGDEERTEAARLIALKDDLERRFAHADEEVRRVEEAYKEALSFANLNVPYERLEHLTFLSMKIGRIPAGSLSALCKALGENALVMPLGADDTKIIAFCAKKNRFMLDTELKKVEFTQMDVPADFMGIPDGVIDSLRADMEKKAAALDALSAEKRNFAETHEARLAELLRRFSLSSQIAAVRAGLESTSLVFRITGWIPAGESRGFMRELDELTESRIAIREYLPSEVPSVLSGEEQVPVKLRHGRFVSAFERMIFSYGSPLYGAIDPTPFVAIFFTILYGIMFGDLGQGLVFLIMGILMALKIIKVENWNRFAPIFMGIGVSSSIMGLITGEFFGTEAVLEPFARFVTGLFGEPRSPILKVMPSSGDPNSVKVIFGIFGVTIALGVVINSIGLIVNFFNNILRRRLGSAFFGKNGLSGMLFYWYVIVFAVRLAFLHMSPQLFDWIIIGVLLFFAAFGEPFERLFDGHRPLLENGFGAFIIGGVVELIEVISNYLSGTISFVRVGAFALAHAVLGFIIEMMSEKCGLVGGSAVLIFGNAIVVVLEGMIVAIQVIRLQYYEFFSKFFHETGLEFKPLEFRYKK